MTRTGCSKRRRVGTHACVEDDVAKDKILERCTKAACKRWFRSMWEIHFFYVVAWREHKKVVSIIREVYIFQTIWYKRQYYDGLINWASRCLYIINRFCSNILGILFPQVYTHCCKSWPSKHAQHTAQLCRSSHTALQQQRIYSTAIQSEPSTQVQLASRWRTNMNGIRYPY